MPSVWGSRLLDQPAPPNPTAFDVGDGQKLETGNRMLAKRGSGRADLRHLESPTLAVPSVFTLLSVKKANCVSKRVWDSPPSGRRW